jgi:hypothetical protein
MAMTFGMDLAPRSAATGGVSWPEVLISHRFGTSAPKAENGFVAGQIVSSELSRRNIQDEKPWNFNASDLDRRGFGEREPD